MIREKFLTYWVKRNHQNNELSKIEDKDRNNIWICFEIAKNQNDIIGFSSKIFSLIFVTQVLIKIAVNKGDVIFKALSEKDEFFFIIGTTENHRYFVFLQNQFCDSASG